MSFIGKLFGWYKYDEIERKDAELDRFRTVARRNGWMDFWPLYSTDNTPYSHPQIWIWRPEWSDMPHLVSPYELDPALNVNGLFWKPAAPDSLTTINEKTRLAEGS